MTYNTVNSAHPVEYASKDTNRYIVRFHERDGLSFERIAAEMNRDLTEVKMRFITCIGNGDTVRFMKELSPFGKVPIDWNRRKFTEEGDDLIKRITEEEDYYADMD